jgi:large subunit ribosomal protein L9
MGLFRQAPDFGEGNDVSQEPKDKQPGVAPHRQQNAKAQDEGDYQIRDNSPNKFHTMGHLICRRWLRKHNLGIQRERRKPFCVNFFFPISIFQIFYRTDFFEIMSKTEVILTHNIVGLGGESDQVKVTAGYARNYLIPQGLAIPLTAANKRRLEVLKQRRAEREAHELNTMTELAKGLSKLICVITVKTGEDGKMFGTVTSGMIADQLKTQFEITLDKRKIHLEHPIRTLGDHEVALRLHADVNTTLKVRVQSTTPPPAPPATPVAEAKKEEPKTEKRGRRQEPAAEKTEAADKKNRPPRGEKPARPDRGPKAQKQAQA